MGRILIHCLDIYVKFAFRNLKSAILVGPLPFALGSVGVLLFALCPAHAQRPNKVFRVGILENAASPRTEAFRQGLRDLGYVEGQNLAIEARFGSDERLPDLAAELVRLKIDVLLRQIRMQSRQLRTLPRLSPLSWRCLAMPLAAALSPVWRGREGTLPG
jgi:putative ABC transport system substrate-binding protein